MIRKHRDDPASADIINLRFCATNTPIDTIKRFTNLLSDAAKTSPSGIAVADYIKGRIALQINAQVKDFTLSDTVV